MIILIFLERDLLLLESCYNVMILIWFFFFFKEYSILYVLYF